jgi:8-oxo-dGTP pyrophosphatase MutT (NUDIX family)
MIEFNQELRNVLQANLARHHRTSIELDGRRHAAVALVVVDSGDGFNDHDDADGGDAGDDDEFLFGDVMVHDIPGDITGLDGRMTGMSGGAAFLLCRRAAGLNSHARQWALPGGRLEPGESPIEAALREVAEEVGVHLNTDAVLGMLDDYPTRSGYVMTPVVLWAGGRVDLISEPTEVAKTYQIGLHQLCRPDSPRFVSIPESDRPVVQVPLGGDLIHAPTGAVLVQFRWVAIEGKVDSRVDTFEQPTFAWK